MLAGGGFQAEFAEDVSDVLFDGSFTDEKLLGNGGVGVPLGHGRQHFLLAVGEIGEEIIPPAPGNQLGNHFRIERCATICHPDDRRQELGDIGDSVFQQVANRTGSGFQQLAGIFGLDVLGENQDRGVRNQRPCLDSRADAFIPEGGRHPDIDNRDIRPVVEHCLDEIGTGFNLFDNRMPGIVQKPGNTFTQKNSVFGDYNS